MGNIFQILRRRKQPSEELDKLQLQIRELESQLKHLLDNRAWTLKCILYCILFFVSTSGAYFWLQHSTLKRKLLSISAILSVGSLAYFAIRLVSVSLFDWLVGRKQKSIRYYTERKVAIIEEVKENEKFKVAKEIIEKYGSKSEIIEWLGLSPSPTLSDKMNNGHHNKKLLRNSFSMEPSTSSSEGLAKKEREEHNNSFPKLYEMQRQQHMVTPHRTPVRPFVQESRTPIDRVLDLVMGESINNRYALICSNCHTHNGMALREEFDIISYYCFRCNFFNPSKAEVTKRNALTVPKLNLKLNFTGNTDESTENEAESERKASTASLNSELSENEETPPLKH